MLNSRREFSRGRKRGRPRSKSAPATIAVDKLRIKETRKKWSPKAMEDAMAAVKNGQMTVFRPTKIYNVPKSTLHDRISGKVRHGDKPGPKPYLSSTEEKELADFLVDVAKVGYGRTRKQVCTIAGSCAHDKGRLESPVVASHGWFVRFMQRQPQLSVRKGDPTANVRMECLTEEVISDYFALLKEEMTKGNFMNSPNRIYNVDETGISLDGHAPRVIALKGQKKVRYRTSGNKNQITVIACVSASGQCIPPFVIFDAKRLNNDWRKDEVPGCSYGLSDKGWVDSGLFKGEHFIEHAVSARPLLLLLDGHSSYYQPELINFTKQYEIVLFCLPTHTTHENQPLDASILKSLNHWQAVCYT